jgi:hypothetical protein
MQPRIALYAVGVSLLLAATTATSLAQTSTSTQSSSSDPQAVVLATQALAALGAGQVSDVTLTGNVTRTVGPDAQAGTITLKALGSSQARMDLSLPNGTLTELRSTANGSSGGSWIFNGTAHPVARHNRFADASWFFPGLSALSSLASNPNAVLKYVGQETRTGSTVQHLRFFVQCPDADPSDLTHHLSTEDIYLDSSSLLVVAVAFNEHPDNNALVDIPVELDFSDYRVVNGVRIPFHIQKFFNGTLLLDITVQSVALNTGLTNAVFSAQ